MKLPSLASSATFLVLISGALASGCHSTPRLGPCDTAQAVGSCAVTVQTQGSRLVVCPAPAANAAPACMSTTLDIQKAGRKPERVQVMLEPGRCLPLSTEVINASSNACQAFAPRSRANPVEQPATAGTDTRAP